MENGTQVTIPVASYPQISAPAGRSGTVGVGKPSNARSPRVRAVVLEEAAVEIDAVFTLHDGVIDARRAVG